MATIYDVAKRASVSVATVSAVVNSSAYVSPELRQRVDAAIAELSYNPNLLARSLAQKKSFSLGVLIPDITNPFYPEVVRGAEDKAKQDGYTILLGNSDNRRDKEELYLNLFLSKRVDGIMMFKASEDMSDALLAKLKGNSIPIVLVGRRYSRLETDCVVADDEAGARAAVRHLIRLGHRRVGIITGFRGVSTTEGRLEGYRKALAAHRIPFDPALVVEGDYGTESGYRGSLRLLEQKPTAIFSTNYLMTVGLMQALEKKGLRCPKDIAVVSYDDFLWTNFFRPKLTCIEQPKYQLGYQAMTLLLGRLNGKHKRVQTVVLKNRLRVRESCGAKGA
ncbi:MAG: LacI family DNA-binding transcriptional regulator [Candidatus Acidiferrales bacterium]